MAFVLNDRVKETTTTTGTGTVNLAGAETGFESFVAGIGNSNTTYYAIVHQSLDEFEVGLGTITDASPDTLARTTVISSSNSDSAVNFSAGTKDVFCTLPASKAVVEDGSDNIALGAAPTVSNASGDFTLDVPGDIILDADGGDIFFQDGGTTFGHVSNVGNNMVIKSFISDNDLVFQGNDGGSQIDALTLDMSEAGAATFNSTINFKFINGSWINSADAINRLYYTANSTSYYKTGDDHLFRNSSDTNMFQIDNSGNGVFKGNLTAYGSPSDLKLKENIEIIENALDKVKQLKGITYTLKSDGNRLTGLVAQDLEKVLPEAVYTAEDIETKDEHLAVRYGNTVGLLVEAIKELEARVKELEDK